MSKRELTPPFDGAVDLPVRVGWYACAWKCGTLRNTPPDSWPLHKWSGDRFSTSGDESVEAILPNSEYLWCGLTAPYSKLKKDHP